MKWILLTIVVLTTVLADLLQSHEMKNAAAVASGERFGLVSVLKAISTRRNLILAIASLTVSFFAFLALVQIQPLSFVVPATAATFVLETLLARLVLNERVDARRAAGALLVLGGIVLLGR